MDGEKKCGQKVTRLPKLFTLSIGLQVRLMCQDLSEGAGCRTLLIRVRLEKKVSERRRV